MKKFLVLCLVVCALVGPTQAQERVIRMPEAPASKFNIAEVDNGFWCVVEAGGGSTLMEGWRNVAMLGVSYIGGYRFNQYLKVGAGVGILCYPNSENVRSTSKKLAMPIFLNIRGNILSDEYRQMIPFWSVNVGTTMPDGFFMTPSVGLRFGEKRNAFLVSLGYTFRHLKTMSNHSSNYSGAMVKIGYEF